MEVSQYDHLHPGGDDYEAGIYRVVGREEQSVTLLRVGDEEGRRVNTGRVVAVDRDRLDSFESAENPDGNRSLTGQLGSGLSGAYWSLRSFVSELVAHPIPAAVAIAVLLAGEFAEQIAFVPDSLSLPLVIAGVLGVTYVGSGLL
jgi:hypothetical protein